METIDENNPESVLHDLEKILEQTSRLEKLIFKFQSIAHIEGRVNKILL
jgi:hypothetical protein